MRILSSSYGFRTSNTLRNSSLFNRRRWGLPKVFENVRKNIQQSCEEYSPSLDLLVEELKESKKIARKRILTTAVYTIKKENDFPSVQKLSKKEKKDVYIMSHC